MEYQIGEKSYEPPILTEEQRHAALELYVEMAMKG